MACAVCKDRFNYLLFNHSLEFFTTTWLETIISQENFTIISGSIMQYLSWLGKMAKSLFIFLFLFFSFRLLLRWNMRNIMWLVIDSQRYNRSHRMVISWSHHNEVTSHSYGIWQRSHLIDMRTVEDKVHSHNSNCIYSVANLMRTLLSSSCQMLIKEQLALFQLRS